jgi:outer membrane lipoprotein-sorting protein
MLVAAAVFLLCSCNGDENGGGPQPVKKPDPEELFRKMEEKVKGAATLQMSFATEIESKERPAKLGGRILIGGGNRARLEVRGTSAGQEVEFVLISDGSDISVKMTDGIEVKREATPGVLRVTLLAAAADMGIMSGLPLAIWLGEVALGQEMPTTPERIMNASNFSLRGTEKVGGREAREVEYVLELLGEVLEPENPFEPGVLMRVWIDAETFLPLKRVTRGIHVMRETYSDVRIGEPIDEKEFRLPGE